ncbi:MAG: hypothetical protein AAGF12_05730 [Myxococcota bacterium]
MKQKTPDVIDRIRGRVVPSVALSMLAHAMAVLALVPDLQGFGGSGGEQGVSGEAGNLVFMSVAGNPGKDPDPAPGLDSEAGAPPAPVITDAPVRWRPNDSITENAPAAVETTGDLPVDVDPGILNGEDEPAAEPMAPAPDTGGPLNAEGEGAGADTPTDSGRLPSDTQGLIDALGLGNSAGTELVGLDACPDPIEGRWRSVKYKRRFGGGQWVRFMLNIRRNGADLTGTIRSRIWTGDSEDRVPPECTPFGSDITVVMPATGVFAGGEATFGARSYRVVAEHCPNRNHDYAPDRFTGSVQGEVFNVRNNDGAFDIDEPYRFHRVSCEPR